MSQGNLLRIAQTWLPLLMLAVCGCAQCCQQPHGGHTWFNGGTDAPPPNVVTVGGHVHTPQKVTIAADGLTLRGAIMAAGGAREVTVRTSGMSDSTAKVDGLIALERLIGKSKTDKILWNLRRETALEQEAAGATAAEEATKRMRESDLSIAENRKSSDAVIEELAKSFDRSSLEVLAGASRNVGEIEQQNVWLTKAPELFDEATKTFGLEPQLQEAIQSETKARNQILGSKVGGVSIQSTRSEFFVVIDRRSMNPPVTYYFPYELVMAGPPGDIPVEDGDSVDLVDVQDTELASQFGAPMSGTSKVLIDGYLKKAGTQLDAATIASVHALSAKTIAHPQSVWMLVRSSPNGMGERIYVLPDRLVAASGAVSKAPTRNGDVFMYVVLPQVPIVFDSLLSGAMEAGSHACRDKIHEKKAEIREAHALRHHYRAMLRAEAQERGKAQAQAKFASGKASGVTSSIINGVRTRMP